MLAGLWMADSQVVFLGPDGGSFAYQVSETGEEQVRQDYGAWQPADTATLPPWQQQVFRLVREALEQM